MIKKYVAKTYTRSIKVCVVEKETAKSVYIKLNHLGRIITERKISKDVGYFDTWQEAKDFLINWAEQEVQYVRKELERCNATLGSIKGLKE